MCLKNQRNMPGLSPHLSLRARTQKSDQSKLPVLGCVSTGTKQNSAAKKRVNISKYMLIHHTCKHHQLPPASLKDRPAHVLRTENWPLLVDHTRGLSALHTWPSSFRLGSRLGSRFGFRLSSSPHFPSCSDVQHRQHHIGELALDGPSLGF